MNRRDLLVSMLGVTGAFALEGFLPSHSARALLRRTAPPVDFDKDPIKVTKLTDNLHLLTGPGGNIAVLTGKEGTLQVDTGVASRTNDIASAVQGITERPTTTIINTHWHFDHTGGNAQMNQKFGATILAHENTRKRLSTEQTNEFFSTKVPPSPPAAFPIVTISENATIFFNAEEVTFSHVAPAHTDSDLFIHFHRANVLHAGDLLFNGLYPFIDFSSAGWIGGMVTAVDRILKETDAQTRFIPGHGPLASRADVTAFRDMLHTVQTRIEAQIKAGKTLDEVVAAKPTKDLDATWGNGMFKGDDFTKIAYLGIVHHNKKS